MFYKPRSERNPKVVSRAGPRAGFRTMPTSAAMQKANRSGISEPGISCWWVIPRDEGRWWKNCREIADTGVLPDGLKEIAAKL